MGQLGGLSPAASIAVGIIVGLLSTSIQSIGLTLQRKSHLLEDSKQDDTHKRPPYRRRRWQIGMLMFIVANLVGSTIQITTLPLPVLSTLQASGLVFNTICASVLLGEPFTRWSLGGTALVAGGAMLIALFGALPEPTHSLDQLLVLLHRPPFIAWMVCTFLAIALILLMIFLLPRLAGSERRPRSRSRSLSRSLTSQSMHTLTPPRLTPRLRLVTGMSLGAVSAVLSAHCLLIAKSAVELLVQTLAYGSNQFNRFESWLILVGLVTFALSQLYFLHKGLKLCSTSVLYPLVFCIYNIIAILDGLIYFNQTSRLPPLHAGLIALGTVILLAGVLALSWRLSDDATKESANVHTYPHAHSPTAAELGQQSLLAPGMGMVDDPATEDGSPASTPDTEAARYSWDGENNDEDEPAPGAGSEHTPLLQRKPSANGRSPGYRTMAPRRARFRDDDEAAVDAWDAWDALMDVGSKELEERSPARARALAKPRRASTMALQRTGERPDATAGGPAQAGTASAPPTPPLRRTRTVAVAPASPGSRWRWVPTSPLTSRTWRPRAADRAPLESGPEGGGDGGALGPAGARRPGALGLGAWVSGWFGRRGQDPSGPRADGHA